MFTHFIEFVLGIAIIYGGFALLIRVLNTIFHVLAVIAGKEQFRRDD